MTLYEDKLEKIKRLIEDELKLARPYFSCTDGSYECALYSTLYYELCDLKKRFEEEETL